MKNLIYLLLLFVKDLIAQDSPYFDESGFFNLLDSPIQPPVKIGGKEYKFIINENKIVAFCPNKDCSKTLKYYGSYPLKVDVPLVSFSEVNSSLKRIDPQIIDKGVPPINKFIQKIEPFDNALFNLSQGISGRKDNVQILIVWNNAKTFLILNNAAQIKTFCNFTMGSGLEVNIGNGVPFMYEQREMLVYEISSSRMAIVGCQPAFREDRINKISKLQLAMNKYRLHNLGGEHLLLQGPCFNQSSDLLPAKLEIKSKSERSQINTIIDISLNISTSLFSATSPFLYYTGIYEFKLSYGPYEFLTDVEIYPYDENQTFEWKEFDQMNNPNFPQEDITLSYQPNIMTFYTIDFENLDKKSLPKFYNKTVAIKSLGNKITIDLDELYMDKLNMYTQVGLFEAKNDAGKVQWSKYFSLIFLNKMFAKKRNLNSSVSQCKEYLKRPNYKKTFSCPDNSVRASSLLSSYLKMDRDVDLVPNGLKNYDCFSQVLPINEKQEIPGHGVTCCYSKDSKYLSYGQEFYAKEDRISGSYSWTYSPFIDPLEHFIHDRIPIHLCCNIISDDTLCYRLWNEQHFITADQIGTDHRGNIFGDPHVIPFRATSNYSFLGWGQYHLIRTEGDIFSVQGRFYSTESQKSLLKAIAFQISDIQVIVTTTSNGVTDQKWKIIKKQFDSSSMCFLPFSIPNLHIFQSPDSQKLNMYITLNGGFQIYLAIERFSYSDNMLEYINMEIHLSNNLQKYITGGMLGRFSSNPEETSLFYRDTNQQVSLESLQNYEQMFHFSVTWKLASVESHLFWDMNFTEEPVFYQPKALAVPQCKDVKFCQIDYYNFMISDSISSSTLSTWEYRLSLDVNLTKIKDQKNVCGYPNWKYVKLNSFNFMEFEKINITGCINNQTKLIHSNTIITCKQISIGIMNWDLNPPFNGEFCIGSDEPTADKDGGQQTIVLASSIGVSVIIILIFILLVSFCVIRNRRKINVTGKSKDARNSKEFQMDIYENSVENIMGNESNYATYAEIQKQIKE